jgi:hypothetical protein
MKIVAFQTPGVNDVRRVNQAQPPSFQRTQAAVIVAYDGVVTRLQKDARMPEHVAEACAHAVLYAFLEHFSDRVDPIGRVFDALVDWQAANEPAPETKGGVA